MKEKALLLGGPVDGPALARLENILAFFGLESTRMTVTEFLSSDACDNVRLFCTTEAFLDLTPACEHISRAAKKIHSAFVTAGDNTASLQNLVQQITGDESAVLVAANENGKWNVTDKMPEFCGAMSGMRVSAKAAGEKALVFNGTKCNAFKIISGENGAALVRCDFHAVPVFVSTAGVIDLDAELTSGIFDIRDHFLSALPVVLYVKWAFGNKCWHSAETNACLVIDDPLLKPTYGFVNFQELLLLMKRHRFSTNVAFIPWNWKRNSPEVIRLFRENPEEYSLSVHGCDHVRGEFGGHDRQYLCWKARQGVERMARHEVETGIHHDPVMVFPQGVFSEAAMSALRHTGLIGAVNNDTISADPHPRAIRIADVWDIAVMSYSSFPLFTRRYPWEGIENFAFDILLGKPCILIIHHDFCRDGYERLMDFIDRVNLVKCPLSWRSLGEVIRRSCRQRELSPDTLEVEMYGTELRIRNRSGQPRRFLIGRRESDPSAIKEVSAGTRPIEWKFSESRIRFEIELNPDQDQTVSVTFRDLDGNGQLRENLSYKARTTFRRYLSEVRDNYVMKYRKRWGLDGIKPGTEERDQKPEITNQRSEGRNQKSRLRRLRTEDGRQRTEDRD